MRWLRIVGTALVLVACGVEGETGQTHSGLGTVSVIQVVDGDSLLVETGTGELEVRLSGVNTPDRGECHHDQARDHLEETLDDAEIAMELQGTDQFGRALVRLTVEGADIALEMVGGGHGLAVATAPDPQPLIDAEETAYQSRLGMWGPHCRSSTTFVVGFDPAASTVDPPGRDQERLEDETLVVANLGDRLVDLSGWTLRDGSSLHRYTFTRGTMLAPAERIEVPSSSPDWAPGGEPVWSNPGDVAILLDDGGGVVARWRYQAPPGG